MIVTTPLMYNEVRVQEITKAVLDAENNFRALGELCLEGLKSNRGLTEYVGTLLLHFYKEVNNELWKRLFCNDDCCPLLGCIQDIEDVEAIQGQAYTIKKDGSEWMQDVLNNKVANSRANFCIRYGIDKDFSTSWSTVINKCDCGTFFKEDLNNEVIFEKFKYGRAQNFF